MADLVVKGCTYAQALLAWISLCTDAKRDCLSLLSSIPNLATCELAQVVGYSKTDVDSGVFSPFQSLLSAWQQQGEGGPTCGLHGVNTCVL